VVVDWEHWERLITERGIEIDRPKGSHLAELVAERKGEGV
jgi:hypothetical protein